MRLKEAIKNLDTSLDCGVILKKENIFYLTGFFPTAFAVLVLQDKPYLAVSEIDASLAKDVDLEVRVIKSFKGELKFKGRIGIEKRHTTVGFVEEYLKGCEVENVKFIGEMRQFKDPEELVKIKKTIKITEDALRRIETVGATEKDVAAKLAYEISKVADLAFNPIVASGKNSAVPHHSPAKKRIKSTEPVIVDLGARYSHYNCDMARTFVQKPSKRFKEVCVAVVEAQKEGIRHIHPGSSVKECDVAVSGVLREYGLEDYFLHSTGHGIGLEVHEQPRISKESEDVFEEGMVVTVEPGVYIPKWGGVRIEDVVLVGKKPKVLTGFSKLFS